MTCLAGAALLVWSGVIHLELWMEGYRSIATIGWLFFLQATSAFALGGLVTVRRRFVWTAAGALLLASTAVGLVWSVELGLFGFQDSFSSPFATQSLGVEAGGVVVLLLACALVRGTRPRA